MGNLAILPSPITRTPQLRVCRIAWIDNGIEGHGLWQDAIPETVDRKRRACGLLMQDNPGVSAWVEFQDRHAGGDLLAAGQGG